jgi:hypothetical protein
LGAGTNNKGVVMKNEDIQVTVLTNNFENLKDENKDKLLLVGKKLLSIKSLVRNDNSSKKNDNEKFENE